jgi:hypothetical protein
VDFNSAAGDHSESAQVSGGEEAETNLRAPSSSTESPEQLRIAALGDFLELSVRSNDFEFHDIINLHANPVHKRVMPTGLHPAAEDADSLGTLEVFCGNQGTYVVLSSSCHQPTLISLVKEHFIIHSASNSCVCLFSRY